MRETGWRRVTPTTHLTPILAAHLRPGDWIVISPTARPRLYRIDGVGHAPDIDEDGTVHPGMKVAVGGIIHVFRLTDRVAGLPGPSKHVRSDNPS